MLKVLKWTAVIAVIAFVTIAVRAAAGTMVYLPVIIRDPTVTPTFTPTATTTPTPTNTPAVTPTRTRTPTVAPGVYITDIVYDPPGDDLAGEYVTIKNTNSSSKNLQNWTLRDDSGNIYTFPSYSLGSGSTVKVWSKAGSNSGNNLYWGSTQPIWNNGGDCAYLRDSDHDISDIECY